MKLTQQESRTLNKINSLILENDNNNSVKKALYAASETYLNTVEMEKEQQPNRDWLSWVIDLITPLISKLADHEVDKLKQHIDNVACGSVSASSNQTLTEKCPEGYTRAADGSCVKDPLPPDPTHQ